MAVVTRRGAIAKYVGKDKGWEHRRGKQMVLQKDTRSSAVQYPFLFEGEERQVHVNYESIEWIQRERVDLEAMAN